MSKSRQRRLAVGGTEDSKLWSEVEFSSASGYEFETWNPDFSKATEVQLVLRSLSKLRWVAVIGQFSAVILAQMVGFQLSLGPIIGVISATAVSNLFLIARLKQKQPVKRVWLFWYMILDLVFLTTLLGLTGGLENPFCELFLVHIAMAVVVLPRALAWRIVAISMACFTVLLVAYQPWETSLANVEWYLKGARWCAHLLTGLLTAYFIGQLQNTLKSRQQQMDSMKEVMVRNEQFSVLTTLAAGAAHELSTPLATIQLAAKELNIAADKAQLEENFKDDLRLIQAEVQRCRRIIDRMHFQDQQHSERETIEVPIDRLIDDLCQDLTEKQVAELQIECDERLDSLILPYRMVYQSLSIILNNALDACLGEAAKVTLLIEARATETLFRVRDRGPGMTQAQLMQVGQPFFTTKAPDRGMGLGLFLTRITVEQLRGTLKIKSRVGEGTEVTLQIPQTSTLL